MTWLPSPSAQNMSSGAAGAIWPCRVVVSVAPALVAASGLPMFPARLSHHR